MRILIAGLPKTGTTGLFYLVVSSMGGNPKLLFEPKECPPGLMTESGDAVAKVLIGPRLKVSTFLRFDRKITIVRDPRDRMVSALLYSQYHADYVFDEGRVRSVLEVLERKERDPSGVPISRIVEETARMRGRRKTMATHLRAVEKELAWFDEYVGMTPDALLYKYEDFVAGNHRVLGEHLDFPMSGSTDTPKRLDRVVRTKGYGDWRNWFTEEDVRQCRPILSPWLEKHGYDADDWTLNPRPFIAPEHCSKYFLRLVSERRNKGPRSNPGVERSADKTRIVRAEPRRVTGWAMGPDPSRPVRVALLVNGTEIARDVADRLRPSLKEKGVHPTGKCGFIFRFESGRALRAGDRVSIRAITPDLPLDDLSRIVATVAKRKRSVRQA